MKMAFSHMFPVLDEKGNQADLTVNIQKDFIDVKPISKEDQRKMWIDIIEKMHSRARANYNKMNEIGNELMKMKDSPEEEKILLLRNFTFVNTSKSRFKDTLVS